MIKCNSRGDSNCIPICIIHITYKTISPTFVCKHICKPSIHNVRKRVVKIRCWAIVGRGRIICRILYHFSKNRVFDNYITMLVSNIEPSRIQKSAIYYLNFGSTGTFYDKIKWIIGFYKTMRYCKSNIIKIQTTFYSQRISMINVRKKIKSYIFNNQLSCRGYYHISIKSIPSTSANSCSIYHKCICNINCVSRSGSSGRSCHIIYIPLTYDRALRISTIGIRISHQITKSP
ncbi:hypothetical protein ABOONEI_1260 [Aciduliprofundum boonei T469]|nr:hypothetical protein ABOONEI_1260 [Aciduliprofundum boonei T469]